MTTQDVHLLSQFDLVKYGPEVSQGISDSLNEEYKTLEELQKVSLKELQEIDGIGSSTASNIKRWVNSTLKEAKTSDDEDDTLDVEMDLITHEPTRAEIEEGKLQQNKRKGDDDQYIIREIPVPGDKFLLRRVRIKLAPYVCDECGFDIIETNRLLGRQLSDWENMDGNQRSIVVRSIESHKSKQHSSPSGRRVISGRELRDTNWTNPETLRP